MAKTLFDNGTIIFGSLRLDREISKYTFDGLVLVKISGSDVYELFDCGDVEESNKTKD